MTLTTKQFPRLTQLALVLSAAAITACSSSNGGNLASGGSAANGGASSLGGSGGGKSGAGGASGSGGASVSGGNGGNSGKTQGGASGNSAGGAPASGGGSGLAGATGAAGKAGAGGAGPAGGSTTQGSGGQAVDGGTPLTCPTPAANGTNYTVDSTGVTFTVGSNTMRLQICQADIIRVQYASGSSIPAKTSLSVNATWPTPSFCVADASSTVTITTSRMNAKVNTTSGVVTFTDLTGNVILAEDSKSLAATTVQGTSTHTVTTVFNSPASEALYGLGNHPDQVMDLKGHTEGILNSNGWINIPMLVSNAGYGVFWDNYSQSNFDATVSGNSKYSYVSSAGDLVDYYFFYGPSIDHVVALYRTATGAAPLFPKWAYGLFNSKDHYTTQSQVLAVETGYRNANIPVDVIVQDWQYWGRYSWGSQIMDPNNYPDPATLVSTLHTNNVHTMISIWPEYYHTSSPPPAVTVDGTTENDQDDYNALNAINALYTDTSGGGYHFYDTFNEAATKLAFQQDYDRLLKPYGWDAIWADNDEPQSYPDGVDVASETTALGKGALYVNAYPLQHNQGIYQNWRATSGFTKRVYVLSRSAFAGQQRYAAGCWSGDINCDFPTFAKQIPAGLNFAIAGMPYWTTDIGGYFGAGTYTGNDSNSELFTRWLEFGSFCPTFRVHGQSTYGRELYNTQQWSSATIANLTAIDNLRYRLIPYIYSLAWMVTDQGYTIMRHLVFDYPTDSKVFNIADQFLFGPAFLVNPIITAGATSRSVYLPAGTWYDFWAGTTTTGGTTVTANAPLAQMPLYVKAGSIVPMTGKAIQYATDTADPLEIRIYPGQNGSFTLYEDEGDTYDYETGAYSLITFTWDDTAKTLSIGDRQGSFTGMTASRTFNIVWVGASHGAGAGITATADKSVTYSGTATSVSQN